MIDFLQHSVDGLLEGSLIALAAIGISLVFAVQRFANVAQAGLMSAGAYTGWLALGANLSMVVALGLTMATGAVLGVLLYFTVFRPLSAAPRITLLIASIGADLVLRNLLSLKWGSDIRGYALPTVENLRLGEVQVQVTGLVIAILAIVVMGVVWCTIRFTKIGREMRALADLPDLARLVNIRPVVVNVWVWSIAGVVAAVAGLCIAAQSSVTPDLGWYALLSAFAAAILGGMGDIRGAVLGGFVMGVAGELSTMFLSPTYKPVLAFALMTAVLLVRPHGILGRAARV